MSFCHSGRSLSSSLCCALIRTGGRRLNWDYSGFVLLLWWNKDTKWRPLASTWAWLRRLKGPVHTHTRTQSLDSILLIPVRLHLVISRFVCQWHNECKVIVGRTQNKTASMVQDQVTSVAGTWSTVCEERLLLGRIFSDPEDLWLRFYFYHSCTDREKGRFSRAATEARACLTELYLDQGAHTEYSDSEWSESQHFINPWGKYVVTVAPRQ